MSTISQKDIAIIGMACRFPKAEDYHQYWENLLAQKSCISDIPHTRWDWRHYDGDPLVEVNKSNSRWGGFIDKVNCFDYRFFWYLPLHSTGDGPATADHARALMGMHGRRWGGTAIAGWEKCGGVYWGV